MSRYIHDKTTHELIPVSGFGSRVATSVNGNTLKVHGSLLDIEGYNYGEGDITTAVQMIAPIESTLVASKAYAKGDQFVYNGLLYKATAAIASGAAIVIGTNASLADSVTEQIQTLVNNTVDQTAGKSIELKYSGMVGYANNTNQPCMFCPFPFEAKNTDYSVSVSSFQVDGVGNATNLSVLGKYKNGVSIKGTLTMTYKQVFGGSATITVTFA